MDLLNKLTHQMHLERVGCNIDTTFITRVYNQMVKLRSKLFHYIQVTRTCILGFSGLHCETDYPVHRILSPYSSHCLVTVSWFKLFGCEEYVPVSEY